MLVGNVLDINCGVPYHLKEKVIDFLGNNGALKTLNIIWDLFSEEVCELDYLAALLKINKSITKLTLSGIEIENNLPNLAGPLKQNSSVKQLSFQSVDFNDDTTKIFLDILKHNNNITKVSLSKVFMNRSRARDWRDYLAQTTTLKELTLSNANIDDELLIILLEGLQQNGSITSLELDSNQFTDLDRLFQVVLSKPHLKTLSIAGIESGFSPGGSAAICNLLKANQLEALDIRWCAIYDDDPRSIIEALKYDHTLKVLNMDSDNIGDASGVLLAEWLNKSTCIQHLNIQDNGFGADTCKAFGCALKHHPSLEVLDMSDWSMSSEVWGWLCDGLKNNTRLRRLELNGTSLDETAFKHLKEILATNESITHLSVLPSCHDDNQIESFFATILANETLESVKISTERLEGYDKVEEKLAQNKKNKNIIRSDLWILCHNIVRQNLVFPSEIWLAILDTVQCRGILIGKLAQKAFKNRKQ